MPDLNETLQRLLERQLAEQKYLGETASAIAEVLQHIPDAPIPCDLSGKAGRLLWYRQRAPLQMIQDMRRVIASPMTKVCHKTGSAVQGHIILTRSQTWEFGASMDLRVFTRHGPAVLAWMTSSPPRLPRGGQVFPVIEFNHRSRPVGKIIRVGSDPLVQRMREADVLPTYRTRMADATVWYDTMGWDCTEPDSIRRILSELETAFSTTTTPKE